MDDPLGEDRLHRRGAGLLIVALDRGHQPAVGVVQERLQVGPAHRLALLARLGIGADADVGQVDRAEVALEGGVGHPQPHLRRRPGFVRLLGAQHRAGPVPHRDQCM